MFIEDNRKLFAAVRDRILKLTWRSSPVMSTLRGIHDYDYTLGDCSMKTMVQTAKEFLQYAKTLECKVDSSLLSTNDAIDYFVALSLAKRNAMQVTHEHSWQNDPSLYVSICIWGCASLLMRDFAPLEERAQSLLYRMREIPDFLVIARENITDPIRVFVQVATDITRASLAFFENVTPQIAASVPSLANDLLKAREVAVKSLRLYLHWLEHQVLPRANGNFAIGQQAYEELVHVEHGLTYNSNDIVRLGTKVLEETLVEIKEVAASINNSIPWRTLIAELKKRHPAREYVVHSYRRAVRDAKNFVLERDLLTLRTCESLEVNETPEFERALLPYAAYFPPAPFETDRKGKLWVTPIGNELDAREQESRLMGHCVYTIPITALHEGYPGHHVQLTRAFDASSPLRKQVMDNLTVEGWALYCEHMMAEQGFCSDPRVRLFQLKNLLWRACRVLIDVGLHSGAMSIDDAVRMLVDKALLEEVNALAEVRRYTMTPTQPMTYAIGLLLILDLRDRMRKKLGKRFSLKRFHDELLRFGSISPVLISEYFDSTSVKDIKQTEDRRIA